MSDPDSAAPVLNPLVKPDAADGQLVGLEPTLRRINDQFARHLRGALLQHLRRPVAVTPIGVDLLPANELIERVTGLTHLTLFAMKPLRGVLVLMIDAPLVGVIVESRFGGDGRFPVNTANREFTPFELRSMQRVVDVTLEQLMMAWQLAGHFEFEVLRHETNIQFTGLAEADAMIVASAFEVIVEHGKGRLAILIPYAAVEPFREQLNFGISAENAEDDPRWAETLMSSVGQAAITLSVELGTIEISVRELMALHPGVVFEMDRPDKILVEANGVPLFRGRWGRHGHKIGILVEDCLVSAVESVAAGMTPANGNVDG
jgi:flagellar motor switch protein FliM